MLNHGINAINKNMKYCLAVLTPNEGLGDCSYAARQCAHAPCCHMLSATTVDLRTL